MLQPYQHIKLLFYPSSEYQLDTVLAFLLALVYLLLFISLRDCVSLCFSFSHWVLSKFLCFLLSLLQNDRGCRHAIHGCTCYRFLCGQFHRVRTCTCPEIDLQIFFKKIRIKPSFKYFRSKIKANMVLVFFFIVIPQGGGNNFQTLLFKSHDWDSNSFFFHQCISRLLIK